MQIVNIVSKIVFLKHCFRLMDQILQSYKWWQWQWHVMNVLFRFYQLWAAKALMTSLFLLTSFRYVLAKVTFQISGSAHVIKCYKNGDKRIHITKTTGPSLFIMIFIDNISQDRGQNSPTILYAEGATIMSLGQTSRCYILIRIIQYKRYKKTYKEAPELLYQLMLDINVH